MAEEHKPPSLEDLDARLRAARSREEVAVGRGPSERTPSSGLGVAMRLAVEMVAGVAVGVGIGWALDRWLGTAPWLMVVFLLLGGAAGVMNAYRAARGLDQTVGLGAAQRRRRPDANGSEGPRVAEHSPMTQFSIVPYVDLKVGGMNVSFTNSSLMMVVAVVLITSFLVLSMRPRALVPGRWQSVAELLYEFVGGMLRDTVGAEGRPYFPFIFSLFMFMLVGDLLGLIPLGFAYTSHIVVTFAMAAVVFIGVTIIGFWRHGFHFLRMFFPEGAPLVTALILVPIELISYFSRPFSLAIRLFANMTVGHIILTVMGGFVVTLGGFYILPGLVPFAFLSAVTVLELGIAVLQAYVFTILSCIYLHDAIHMH